MQGVKKVKSSGEKRQVHPALPHAVERTARRKARAHRPRPRAARRTGGREAVGRVGPPHGRRCPRRAAATSWRGSSSGGRAAGRLRARTRRPRDRLRRTRRHPRCQRQWQDDVAPHPARARSRSSRGRNASALSVVLGRLEQARDTFSVDGTLIDAFQRASGADAVRVPLDAREVRTRRRTRAALGPHAFARRAHRAVLALFTTPA